MNEQTKKLQQQQQEQETTRAHLGAQETVAREFSSVEEMLQFDASQTQVPPSVEMRLADSVQKQLATRKRRRWWEKLFG